MNNTEEWKTIPTYPDYMVSNLGRVKSFKVYEDGYLLKPGKSTKGYYQVGLFKPGERKKTNKSIHGLVMLTFVGERPADKPEIRHLDGDKSNNALSNLVYGTAKENAADRLSHGTFKPFFHSGEGAPIGEKHPRSKLTEDEVYSIRALLAFGCKPIRIAEMFSLNSSYIHKIKNRTTWSHI